MASYPPGLYVVPTPLGNMGDMTPRSVAALRKASLAASEDTRRTARLLNFLGISLPQVSYREQSHASAWPRVRDVLSRGLSVALMTDAGSPGISDPGAALCAAARAGGFGVYPLPGASAVTAALSVAGFPAPSFSFCGFPPPRGPARRSWLAAFRRLAHPLVFFEGPHRLEESLSDLLEVLGPRRALVAREMTKLHEEYLFGDLGELLEDVKAVPRKGEVTVVVEGAPRGRVAASRTEGFFEEMAGGGGALREDGGRGDWEPGDSCPGGPEPFEFRDGPALGLDFPGGPEAPESHEDHEDARDSGSSLPPGASDAPRGPQTGGERGLGAPDAGREDPPAEGAGDPPAEGAVRNGGEAGRGPLCSARSVAALKVLWEAVRADGRRLSESAGELSGLTGIPRKALYPLLSHFRSPEG
ncbi:MAG: 16S rRNA (cytidine(1402)-2'-O)-methyltransferase [Deltaproteobacteria bacterium]|jgi:16S rRNA (cytidine1402-2'-O)-methyltransferase|nr:16S rRNA (cytidine(1402)-2'-O)-methyltransferase [Deltaproteobacteria bacterium]